jgi:hypothetical protein
MKEIIKEILPLGQQFYSCVGREREREREKKNNKRYESKRKMNFFLIEIWICERRLFHLFQKIIIFGVRLKLNVLKKPDCFRTTNFILLIVLC